MTDTQLLQSPFYRVSLKALVFDANNKLLVVKNGEDNAWEIPGGGWEYGEDIEQCLQREFKEELNATVSRIYLERTYAYTGKRPQGGMALKIALFVELAEFNFTVGDDIVDYKFVTAEELQALEMVDSETGIKNHAEQIWAA